MHRENSGRRTAERCPRIVDGCNRQNRRFIGADWPVAISAHTSVHLSLSSTMYNRRRNDLRTLLMDHLDLGPEAAYMDEATFQEAVRYQLVTPSRRRTSRGARMRRGAATATSRR